MNETMREEPDLSSAEGDVEIVIKVVKTGVGLH